MFFNPQDYLESDPAQAESEREAARLRREAEQRARLCAVMTRLTAESGFEGAKIYLVAREAKLGLGTFYKLFASREACLMEAFERCAAVFLGQVEEGLAEPAAPAERAATALRRAADAFAADADVARLLLIEVRAGDGACREAQQRWSGQLATLLAARCDAGDAADGGWVAEMVVGALLTLLAAELEPATGGRLPGRMLPDLIYALLVPYLGVERAIAAMRNAQQELIRSGE